LTEISTTSPVDPVPATDFAERVAAARMIPVLRTGSAQEAVRSTGICFDAGLTMVELTATTPDWPAALRQARADHPGRLIGLGTVLRAEQAVQALETGADFIVSPCPAPEVREVLADRLPFMEGGLTVGEVLAAASRGIAKLFPAHVGGLTYLRSLLAVAPEARVVPTGGIALADVPAWLAAGALAVGVGRDLLAAEDVGSAVRRALEPPEH
jgi:2-dehydro-3-deoxyphosphogluconate aldolase/(4S)-4-hydroxy-2-oxoglutarate aldolase